MKRRPENPLTNQRGAASVLIIFMMLILVTLGAFAITSANVNKKLSERVLEWNNIYYEMDAKGEQLLAKLDNKLAEAEAEALLYMRERKYAAPEAPGIPEELQMEIYAGYSEGNYDSNYLAEVMKDIYMYHSSVLVNTFADSDITVDTVENGSFVEYILLQATINANLSNEENRGLNISVWVEPVEYTAAEENGVVTLASSSTGPRYTIEDWYEYQEPKTSEQEEELWDGSL